MSLASLDFVVNCQDTTRKGRLVSFDAQGVDDSGQLLMRHETVTVNLRPVKPGISTDWVDLDVEAARAANGVRLGVGEFDKAPATGSWPLALNGDSTGLTALDGSITADALKALLIANPAVVAAGGISAVTLTGRTYRIYYTTTGAKPDFTTTDNDLLPLSAVSISRAVVGDDTHKEVVAITVKRRPYAYCDSWTAAPAANVSCAITIAGAAVDPKADCVQTITLTPGCYDGRYSIPVVLPNTGTGDGGTNITQAITFFATDDADAMLARLQTHPEVVKDGTSGVSVTGVAGGPYTVTFINHLGSLVIAEMVPANIDLAAPRTLTGDLDLNQDGMAEFFDTVTGDTASLVVELEIQFPGGSPAKPFQDAWTFGRDLFDNETLRPRTDATFPTNGEIVRYLRDITDFAGLSAIDTAGGSVQCVVVSIAGAPRMWELVAGTDATDTASGIQRPDDFDADTNAYVWKSVF